jgi:hypothetical protein
MCDFIVAKTITEALDAVLNETGKSWKLSAIHAKD